MEREALGTLQAADALAKVPWAQPLLASARPTVEWVREKFTTEGVHVGRQPEPHEQASLFEIRFARALHEAGTVAGYEYPTGVGGTSVDFGIGAPATWLAELVCLRESDAIRAAKSISDETGNSWTMTLETGKRSPVTGEPRPEESPEAEYIKAEERIGMKVFDGKRAVKFPERGPKYNLIVVDGRGVLGGGGDHGDWGHLTYGAVGRHPAQIHAWTDPKTGIRAPILGLYEANNPTESARVIRERVHAIAFINERTYAAGEIKQGLYICANPTLFRDEEAARLALATFPLGSPAPFGAAWPAVR